MPKVRYTPLGPLLSGKGSRAFLGLEIPEANPLDAQPIVLVWLPEDVLADRELIAAVQKETNRAAQLDHPHIIRVHGFIRHEQGMARVVEYADGESLRRVLEAAGKLPAPLAARVAADAAMGVHYAHVAGNDDGTPLVHADLRPETMLVSYSGQSKVSGYGALAVAPKEVGGRRVRGRRSHCAPEQVLGGRSAVNVQTDVYLLGLMLSECLTGQVPYEGEVDFDQAVLTAPVPELPPELCPPALMEVIRRSMAKKANDRYPTALALREAIEQAIGELPTHGAFADYLKQFFPEDQPARMARRRMLEEGMEQLRAAGAQSLPAPVPPPAEPSADVTVPMGTLPGNVTAPAAPQQPARPPPPAAPPLASSPPPTAEQPVFGSHRPPAPGVKSASHILWAIVGIVVLGGIISVWALRSGAPERLPEPNNGTSVQANVVPDAGMTAAAEVPDAGPAMAQAPGAPDASVPAVGETTGTPGGGTQEPAQPEKTGTLALTVEPPVDVMLGNKPLGRAPFTISLPAGRHVLKLTNKAKGITTTRIVQIAPDTTTTERVYLRRGYINVVAPDGSQIFIDGKSMGKAPQRDIGLYEGSHKILVTVSTFRWQQAFDLKPDERTTFTVDFR